MEPSEWALEYYTLPSGLAPFAEWRSGIVDVRAKAAIDARIARMRGGNFGDSRPIGKGASESRVDFGPGFRIYYAMDDRKIVLLDGGDKSTQAADISSALRFWEDYKSRKKKHEEKSDLQKRSSKRFKKR